MVTGIFIGAVVTLVAHLIWDAIRGRLRLNRRNRYRDGSRGVRAAYLSMLNHNEETELNRFFGLKKRRALSPE